MSRNKKSWQFFTALECPECGGGIEVYANEQNDEFEQFAYDGDDCKCSEYDCNFKSCVIVTEEGYLDVQ